MASPRPAKRRRGGRGAAEDDAEDAVVSAAMNEIEEEGEDILENAAGDYTAMPVLDRYDARDLDQRNYQDMSFNARRAAEAQIADREALEGRRRGGRVPLALMEDDDDEVAAGGGARLRRERMRAEAGLDAGYSPRAVDAPAAAAAGGAAGGAPESFTFPEDTADGVAFRLEDYEGNKLRDFIQEDRCKLEVKRRFRDFLRQFRPEDNPEERLYLNKVRQMTRENHQALKVDYTHLSHAVCTLAVWVTDVPNLLFPILDEALMEVATGLYETYADVHKEVHVRITNLPLADSLRSLRQDHLNCLVKVSGVVTRRTGKFPQLTTLHFDCVKCGYILGPFSQLQNSGGDGDVQSQLGACPQCESRGPFQLNHEQTVYRDFQKLTLQESPGSVPAGRVPRTKEVILTADLVDCARPGEEVEVTGTYVNNYDAALNSKQGFPVFATVIHANHVVKLSETKDASLTEQDLDQIHKLSKQPNIGSRIAASIAPSIFGAAHVKMAVALALFGGCEKNIDGKHRIRGDINVLLLGDPGTAKSQFLKYIEKTAPRAVYTTGKGASAVGLTASVHKDPTTREWTLEGGALVLADRGVCMIDEFDKMSEGDRTSIHEAMEQQSISISKAGIVTTLQARCCVMAAANPIGGRYDPSRTFAENVELTDPIIQRFDILCVLQDVVDPIADERLAKFVTGSHMKSHPQFMERYGGRDAYADEKDVTDPDVMAAAAKTGTSSDSFRFVGDETGTHFGVPKEKQLSQDLLRKYIAYGRRETYKPKLADINMPKIENLYADLRRASERSGGVPIAVRHIESILRMSEAHARMVRSRLIDPAAPPLCCTYAL